MLDGAEDVGDVGTEHPAQALRPTTPGAGQRVHPGAPAPVGEAHLGAGRLQLRAATPTPSTPAIPLLAAIRAQAAHKVAGRAISCSIERVPLTPLR